MASKKHITGSKWHIRWTDYQLGKRPTVVFYGTKSEAEKKRIQLQNIEINMKAGFKPERLLIECTISELNKWFYDEGLKWKNGQREKPIKQGTIDCYNKAFANFSECFGSNCQINHLKTVEYRDYYSDRQLSGLNVDIRAFLAIISVAVNHPNGPLTQKPKDLWKYKLKKKSIPYLELDQVNKILTTPMEPETRDMFLMYLHTGCRLDGLLSLTWDNVDFQNKTITVIEKADSKRTIYITETVFEILMKWSHRERPMPYTNTKVAIRFNKLRKDSGVYFSSRWLRATCGSFMLSSGCSIEQVAEHLGHADIQTTRRWYAKIIDDQKEKAIKKFSNFVSHAVTTSVSSTISIGN